MKRAFGASLILVLAVVILAACGSSANTATAESQRQFGVRMARMNLWREAMFRFKRAVEIEPSNAMAHNNLAVAYEANGDFDNAAKEYREALRLDRGNQFIQKNYSRFVEFTTRSKKRAPAAAATATTTASPAGTTTVTATGVTGTSDTPPPHSGPTDTALPTAPPPTDTTTTKPPAVPDMKDFLQ
jgi:Tfp pilus assembly protein PilF